MADSEHDRARKPAAKAPKPKVPLTGDAIPAKGAPGHTLDEEQSQALELSVDSAGGYVVPRQLGGAKKQPKGKRK